MVHQLGPDVCTWARHGLPVRPVMYGPQHVANAPFPARTHTHRMMVSPAHHCSGEVWRLSIVRSALKPDKGRKSRPETLLLQPPPPCSGLGGSPTAHPCCLLTLPQPLRLVLRCLFWWRPAILP